MRDPAIKTDGTGTGVGEPPAEPPKLPRDRELIELLTELRVALPGVQVLFAFLRTVPFTARFEQLSRVNRDAYFVAFTSSAAASAFLIAPSAYHRMRWRQGDKERMLRVSNHLAIAGIAALAVGVTAFVYLITALLYGTVPAVGGAIAIAGMITWLWFVLPLQHRESHRRRSQLHRRDDCGRRTCPSALSQRIAPEEDMAVVPHVSSAATPSRRDLRPDRAHPRLVSALLLTMFVAVTGVVTGS